MDADKICFISLFLAAEMMYLLEPSKQQQAIDIATKLTQVSPLDNKVTQTDIEE